MAGKDKGLARGSGELARLRLEKEAMALQVKRLVKAEGKLYEYQEKLDAQLAEYQNLYELSRKLNASPDIESVFELAVQYVINYLGYERVVIFRRQEDGTYAICALDGYYGRDEKKSVEAIVLDQCDHVFCSFEKDEYVIGNASTEKAWLEISRRLLMDEYMICPLVPGLRPFALLAIGNCSANAAFYRRVNGDKPAMLSVGNLVALLTASLENQIYRASMEKALQQEKMAEAKYRGIFENALEGIFQTTIGGQFLSANPAMAAMLGYNGPEEMISSMNGMAQQLYVNPADRERLLSLLGESGKFLGQEVQFLRKDNGRVWVSISAHMAQGAGGNRLIIEGLATDITERKAAEEGLEKAHEELEQRVRERTAELSATNALLDRRHKEATALYRVSAVLSRSLHMDTLLGEVLEEIAGLEAFETKKAGIFIVEGGRMRLIAHLGHSEQFLNLHNGMRVGDCLCGIAARTGEVIISGNSSTDAGHTFKCGEVGPHGHIILPLKAKDSILGVLYLYTPAGKEIDKSKLDLLQLLGNQLGIAMENTMLYEKTRALSLHDSLTGLWNHEEILRILESELVRAAREISRVGVIMADLDDFKRINDLYGHLAGDEVIRFAAKAMLSQVRPYDSVGRYGGEEFLFVLPGCNDKCTAAIAERLCQLMRTRSVDTLQGQVSVTVSLGTAVSGSGSSVNSLVHAADMALYRAKKNGKYRVEAAPYFHEITEKH